MKIRRPRLVNRAPFKRVTPIISPAQKQSSQLLSLYQEITKKISILNQISQSLELDQGNNFSKFQDVTNQLLDSIDSVLDSYLYEVQQISTQEAEKLRSLFAKSIGNKDLSKVISETLSIFISFSHLQPNLGIALSTDDNNCKFFDKNNPDNEHKVSALPSLYRSADSSMDNLTLCSSTEPSSSKLITDQNDDENPTVLCRICEKLIPLDLMEKHSALCIQAHQAKYQIIKSSDKLKKFNTKLSNQLSVNLPGEMKEATTILYPLLYLYLTIDIAISFKGEESGAIPALDSALNGLNSIKMPKAASQYASLFEHGAILIQKKLNGLNEIEQKSKEIAKTTVDHSVGNFYKESDLSDFEFLSRVSAGAFARVYIAKKKTTGDLYAIKVIKKTFANLKNQIRTVTVERDIMMRLHSPYMVNFYYSFIKKNNLYLVMEYLPGGDIYSLLQSVGSLPEDSTRVYICQVVKALQFLRENQIIHRDLKPDNLLVDSRGFLRLTDFGLSLCGINGFQLSTRVGTPDYMAPEIVLPQNYSFSCDYWSLGVMTYEMLYGEPPFHGETEDETFKNILIGDLDLSVLEDVSETCKDFIAKLLNPDPKKRLGAERFEEIMEHPWFNGIDWNKVNEMEPVFVPDLHDDTQNDYFTSRYEFPEDAENDIREDLKEQKTESIQKDEDNKNASNNNNNNNNNEKQSTTSNNQNASQSSSSQKRVTRRRSSTLTIHDARLNLFDQDDLPPSNLSKPAPEENATPAVAKTDESLNFEKVSLQHLKTMNEGETEKIRRKRSSTVAGPPQFIPGMDSDNDNDNSNESSDPKIRRTSSLLLNNNNSIINPTTNTAPVKKEIKMLQLEKSHRCLSSSTFHLPKYKPPVALPTPPTCLSSRSYLKPNLNQRQHMRTNNVRQFSAPKSMRSESSFYLPHLANDNAQNLSPIYPEVKTSNSFSNLSSILTSSKYNNDNDCIFASSSSPSKCRYDDLGKKNSFSNINLPYKGGQ